MKIFICLLIICFALKLSANAQDYVVPVNYKFASADDFKKYEPQILETIQWLQLTPWNVETPKRKAATAFLFKWIQNTPTLTIELMPALIDLTDRNNHLMAAFMGGYIKFALQNPDFTKDSANDAAVKALINKYRAEPLHKTDKDVEHLITLQTQGQLETWVRGEYQKQAGL